MRPLAALRWSAFIVPFAVAAAFALESYLTTLDRAGQQSINTARVLREHALRVFEAQAGAIDTVDARLAGLDWDEIERSEAVHLLLQKIAADSPHIDGLSLIRPDGRAASSATQFPMPETWVTDRDYYQALKTQDTLFIGQVVVGRVSGNLNFSLSRRRSTPDGSFDGLILLTTGMDYFERFWRGVLGRDRHIAGIVRDDGSTLVRYPPLASPPSKIPADSPFFEVISQGSGSYQLRSITDGAMRIYGLERLGEFPAYVFVGLHRGEILRGWIRNAVILAVLAVIGSGLLVTLVHMAERREQRLQSEVDRRETAEKEVVAKADHIAALEAAQAALRDSETRFRIAQELSVDGFTILKAVRDGGGRITDFEWLYANPAAAQLLKRTVAELQGHRLLQVLPGNGVPGGLFEKYVAVVETGTPHDIELFYDKDGISGWLRIVTVRLGDGIAVYFSDISRRKQAQARQAMLMSELDHRVKNMLAVTHAIARQSIKGDAEDHARFIGRFGALANAYTLLSEHRWQSVDFRRSLEMTFAPYARHGERRFSAIGPDFSLSPKLAQSVSLNLYELATNAFKYGALSVTSGHVDISWRIEGGDRPRLCMAWRERGGPPVAEPTRSGFGTKFVKQSVAHDLRGSAAFSYLPNGLVVEFTFPIDRDSIMFADREMAS